MGGGVIGPIVSTRGHCRCRGETERLRKRGGKRKAQKRGEGKSPKEMIIKELTREGKKSSLTPASTSKGISSSPINKKTTRRMNGAWPEEKVTVCREREHSEGGKKPTGRAMRIVTWSLG